MSGTRWWRPWTWRIGGASRPGWRILAWLLRMPPARGNENNAAFRAMTVLRLGPGFGNRVVWGRGQLPTVTNWGLMERSRAFDDFDRQAVLLDISEVQAGVEEVILHLQSGHGLPRAARTYMHLQDPRRLFERPSRPSACDSRRPSRPKMAWWIWDLGSPPPDPTPRPERRLGPRGSCDGRSGPGGTVGGRAEHSL